MQDHIWAVEVNFSGKWKPVDFCLTRKGARTIRTRRYAREHSRIRKFIAA